MIGDVCRTGTYRKAILGNAAVAIRDKAVLDLGAGESRVASVANAECCPVLVLRGCRREGGSCVGRYDVRGELGGG